MAIHKTINNIRPVKDVLALAELLDGELTEEDAKATLAEFLFHNPRFLMELIGGIQMYPMQEIVIKGWAANDYNLLVASRGFGKSFLVAIFALYWAMFHPKTRIVIASAAFRQSRAILEMCNKLVKDEGADRLRACFPDDMRRGTDEYLLEVPNGAVIRCLPLGDGKKIRGVRADVLIVDEYAYLPESVIDEVLRPFLAAKGRIKEQRTVDAREKRLIEQGKMREDQRTVLEDRKKVIFLSSASWTFQHLYKRYREWTDVLLLDPTVKANETKIEEFRKAGRSFFIARVAWEAAPVGLLDLEQIKQDKASMSEVMFNREYGAQFTSDSDGFFRAAKMELCTVPDKEEPTMELVGVPGEEYVLGIDQNSSGAEDSDHFAMCLMKIVRRETDGKRIGMVVHQYAVAGCGFTDHALYLYYLLKHFNIVYIGVDASQGGELEFINFCNQLPQFEKLKLHPVDDMDFNRTDFTAMLPDIRRGYNVQQRQIVQKQRFSSEWQRPANEYLQACFDHRNIRFAAKIAASDNSSSAAMGVDISMLKNHEEFREMSISDFIVEQDMKQELVKKECAMIQVKVTDLGTMSFGLPQVLKRTSGPNRVRKDSYSALLIANWSLKTYVEMMEINVEVQTTELEYRLGG